MSGVDIIFTTLMLCSQNCSKELLSQCECHRHRLNGYNHLPTVLLRIKSSDQPDMSAHTCRPSIYQAVRIRVQGHSGPCFKKKKKKLPLPPSIHIHRTKGAYFTFKLGMIVKAAPHLKGPFPGLVRLLGAHHRAGSQQGETPQGLHFLQPSSTKHLLN